VQPRHVSGRTRLSDEDRPKQERPGRITRRQFVAGLSAAALPLAPGPSFGQAPAAGLRTLHARPMAALLRGPGRPATPVWAYDGIPGPVIRARRGWDVQVRLTNGLPTPTLIHWHGVRLANAMDGTLLTQTPVAPGESFDYRFVAPDAGTFWYHAGASAAAESVGLAGVLVIEDERDPEVDQDLVVLLQSWPAGDEGGPAGAQAGSGAITVNGLPSLDVLVHTHERLRLRLVNAAAPLLSLRLDRHLLRVMAIDGQPAEPFWARDSRIFLGYGNRMDLFVDAALEPGTTASLVLEGRNGNTDLLQFHYAETSRGSAARPDPAALAPNPLPQRMDFRTARKLDLPIDARDPWSADGGIPAKPLFSVKRGQTVMLALINRMPAPHAIHVHGHPFRWLDRLDDGWKPFWLDTLTVPPGETMRVAFVADNPGRWMIDGYRPGQLPLSTWFEVL
jgi:FtsP/CotA-like multicopper oxidase with cupredoxin domain